MVKEFGTRCNPQTLVIVHKLEHQTISNLIMADTDTSVEGQKMPVKNLFLSYTDEWSL